jgi:arylsulfatase A
MKRDLYEGGHRVPFVIKWPGAVQPGSVSDALTSQVDLFATIAAIVGHELPTGIAEDSYDLSDVWKQNATSPRRSIVHNTVANAYAIRHEDWVLIAHPTGAHTQVPTWFDEENDYQSHEQPGELYNLRLDLAQRHNLYATETAKVEELTEVLESIRAKGQVR